MEKDIRELIARLLARQHLPREDRLVTRALIDDAFRQDLEIRLHACGLKFIDNPYAGHVTLGIERDMEQAVLGEQETWLSNTMGLDRSAIALLVVLWALIILPKRQRQIERKELEEGQEQQEMFPDEKSLETGRSVSAPISQKALISDFGDKLGKKSWIMRNLGVLARMGFIVKRQEEIYEGPLLDLLLDYGLLAGRVLEGALHDLLVRRPKEAVPPADPAGEGETEAAPDV